MKKRYEVPQMELGELTSEDVMQTSGGVETPLVPEEKTE